MFHQHAVSPQLKYVKPSCVLVIRSGIEMSRLEPKDLSLMNSDTSVHGARAKISVILGSSSFQTSMHGVKLNFENSSERRKYVQIAMLLEHHPQKYQKVYMWLQH